MNQADRARCSHGRHCKILMSRDNFGAVDLVQGQNGLFSLSQGGRHTARSTAPQRKRNKKDGDGVEVAGQRHRDTDQLLQQQISSPVHTARPKNYILAWDAEKANNSCW